MFTIQNVTINPIQGWTPKVSLTSSDFDLANIIQGVSPRIFNLQTISRSRCSLAIAAPFGGGCVTPPPCPAVPPAGSDVWVRGQPAHAPQEGQGEGKLDGVAMLVTDPPRGYSTTRQNPHICNHPLYIAFTFKLFMRFKTPVWFKCCNIAKTELESLIECSVAQCKMS